MLVDEHDTIIAGEARVDAARRVGMTEVPVIVAHHWSAAQVRAYRLADNRLAELSRWNEDALAIKLAAIIELDENPIEVLGWETGEIDLLLDCDGADMGTVDPADNQLEPEDQPVSRPGDLWLLGEHRLLCDSSLEAGTWARLMDGKIAAMAFTDPPYNLPVSGHVCGLGKVAHREFEVTQVWN